MSVRCIATGLDQPECSCATCLRELLVTQLSAKKNQPPKEES